MKEILFNGRFMLRRSTGVERYAVELLKALDNLIDRGVIVKDINFTILVPREVDASFKHIRIKVVSWGLGGNLWEQLVLPFISRGKILINLCNAAPILKKNQIVTIHDAAVYAQPAAYSYVFCFWYRFMLKRIGKRSLLVVVPSMFSKSELEKYGVADGLKVWVIGRGRDHVLSVKRDESILEKNNLIFGKYLLAVSSMNPNKNFMRVLEALNILGQAGQQTYDVVIAGDLNRKVFKTNLDIENLKIRYLGYVNEEELVALYHGAGCFLYPSIYEGYGLPPLEAMSCGCPVIISNVASLPEVYGNAALYCNPYDSNDIAGKIDLLMHDEKLRDSLIKKGTAFAEKNTWEKVVKEFYLAVQQVS